MSSSDVEAAPVRPASLEEDIVAAQDAYFNGDYSGAVAAAKAVLLASPVEADAYEILTMALMQQRNYDLAAEVRSSYGRRERERR